MLSRFDYLYVKFISPQPTANVIQSKITETVKYTELYDNVATFNIVTWSNMHFAR